MRCSPLLPWIRGSAAAQPSRSPQRRDCPLLGRSWKAPPLGLLQQDLRKRETTSRGAMRWQAHANVCRWANGQQNTRSVNARQPIGLHDLTTPTPLPPPYLVSLGSRRRHHCGLCWKPLPPHAPPRRRRPPPPRPWRPPTPSGPAPLAAAPPRPASPTTPAPPRRRSTPRSSPPAPQTHGL